MPLNSEGIYTSEAPLNQLVHRIRTCPHNQILTHRKRDSQEVENRRNANQQIENAAFNANGRCFFANRFGNVVKQCRIF
jgi:hypothetical protein